MLVDIIAISGVIIGAILIYLNKKKPTMKHLKKVGILIIIISLLIGLPDFLEGFQEGYISGSHLGS